MAENRKQLTKKQKREAAQKARLAAERKRRRARRNRTIAAWTVIGLVAAAGAVYGIVRAREARQTEQVAAREAGCSEVQTLDEVVSSPHVERGAAHAPYNSNPPTSGPHMGNTAPWGAFDETIEPELYVHNMEHGAIIIHYNGLPDGDVDALAELADSYEDGIISMPNDTIDKPIAIAAWTKLRTCDRFSPRVIEAFIDEHCNNAPEKLVSCRKR